MRNVILTVSFLGQVAASGQTKIQAGYVSPADQELSIKSIVVVPFTDSLSGIYAKPLTQKAQEILGNDPQWTLQTYPAKADAQLTGHVLKGTGGITLRLELAVGSSNLPLVTEESVEPQRFDIERMKAVLAESLNRLREKMPYRGVVLSRRGQEITLNIGRHQGLRDGATISIIQILKIARHPKKSFLVGTEKEILGKARVTKADDDLSFASVTFEKEPNLISVGMKVLPDEMVQYADPGVTGDNVAASEIEGRGDKKVAFGEKPVAWLPEPTPQYGRVQILAGLGQYSETAAFHSAGSVGGSNSTTPNLAVAGEAWVSPEWFVNFDLRQSAFSIANGLNGSSPQKLNVSLSRYDVGFGRTFLLGTDFIGPKIQLGLGLGQLTADVDSSSPVLFSNTHFGGLHFSFLFTTPVSDDNIWDIGARLRHTQFPSVSESVSSGNLGATNITDFSFMVGKKVRQNFRYVGELDFESYNADFSDGTVRPDPVSNVTIRATTLLVGLEYLF